MTEDPFILDDMTRHMFCLCKTPGGMQTPIFVISDPYIQLCFCVA